MKEGKQMKTQGLYEPSLEHDNCGIGAIIQMKGIKSHQVVEDALTIVEHLEHRAGKDASGQVGDGVGILLQIPHGFFQKVFDATCTERYGVGMFFLPNDAGECKKAQEEFACILENEGLHLLGGSIVQYRKLSELFVEYYEPNRKKLEESFETTRKTQQEIKILTGQIHTLKSNARAIGAMSLYELAASLEIRGKMQDESYIEKAIPLLFFEWERALDGMFFFLENTKKFLLESEKKEKENGKQKVYGEMTEEVNQGKLYEEIYDRILEAIGKYQGKYAEEQLEKLLSLEKNPKKKKILGQVQKSVQNLEFEQAESLMKGTYWTNKVTTEWEDRNGQK